MSKENNLIFDEVPTSGPLAVPMTNDYLFKAMLQKNNKILKGLLCALLALKPEQIRSVQVTNPIELGESIDDKTFILDVLLILNDNSYYDLEMQVINEHNWVERSLSYLCRTYDNLCKGKNYVDVMPVHQIGILNYTLFPENPEFYSEYGFVNRSTLQAYSDKIKLSVLDLTQIDLATEKDKENELDYWARLFKSETWEELQMLAEKDPIFKEVATQVKELTDEEKIRMQCEAREDYYRTQNDFHGYYLKQLDEKDKTIDKKDKTIEELNKEIAKLQEELRMKQ
ncbi:conserved hypothetical protein (putative transposase or invertase) [Lachnospiraceae bacterium G11]|nr:conserved hypothetical protein (putative transposase or invertase) [Lachnospiraceae bacterium G11]